MFTPTVGTKSLVNLPLPLVGFKSTILVMFRSNDEDEMFKLQIKTCCVGLSTGLTSAPSKIAVLKSKLEGNEMC